MIGAAQEFGACPSLCNICGLSSPCTSRTKADPVKQLCFGLSISNYGSIVGALSNLSPHGCQRSWKRLRLVTEQGKQLVLNSGGIASLYSCEGYRLAPIWYSGGSGAKLFDSFSHKI